MVMTSGPLKDLMSRAVVVIDVEGVVRYTWQVSDITQEPDYAAALVALKQEIFRADFCSQPVTQVAFTPDGASLAVSDGNSPIQLLDLVRLRRQLAAIGLEW